MDNLLVTRRTDGRTDGRNAESKTNGAGGKKKDRASSGTEREFLCVCVCIRTYGRMGRAGPGRAGQVGRYPR